MWGFMICVICNHSFMRCPCQSFESASRIHKEVRDNLDKRLIAEYGSLENAEKKSKALFDAMDEVSKYYTQKMIEDL